MDPLGLKKLTKKFITPSNVLQKELNSDQSSSNQLSEQQQQTSSKSNWSNNQESDQIQQMPINPQSDQQVPGKSKNTEIIKYPAHPASQQILAESIHMTHPESSQPSHYFANNSKSTVHSEQSGSNFQANPQITETNRGGQIAGKSQPVALELVYGRKSPPIVIETPENVHVSENIPITETQPVKGISSVCQILASQISAGQTSTAFTSQTSASQTSASQTSASRTSASQTGIICDQCGAKFGKVNKLREHKIKHDGKACQYCAKIYHSYSSLRFHMDSKHSAKTFECLRCGDSFSGLVVLRRHEKTSACQNQQNREKNSFCEICGRGYKTKKAMRAHLKKHEVDSDND